MKRYLISLLAAACCVVAFPDSADAQETINHASLGGRVTDPQGAVVPGAAVRIKLRVSGLGQGAMHLLAFQ